MKNNIIDIKRRHLPHWRLEGVVYFVTWRLKAGQPPLVPAERDLVLETIQFYHRKKYNISAYVIMDDHVHLLMFLLENFQLSKVIQDLKRYTSRMIKKDFGRETPIWQDEFFDRIVRDETEFHQKGEYILTNPQRRWPNIVNYPWIGIID